MATCPTNDLTFTELPKGSSRTLEMTVKQEDGITLVDLTGSTVYFTIRKYLGSSQELVYKTSDDATEAEILLPQTGANLGKARFFIVPADTTNLEPGTYIYDAWVEFPGGERYSVIGPAEVQIAETVTKTF